MEYFARNFDGDLGGHLLTSFFRLSYTIILPDEAVNSHVRLNLTATRLPFRRYQEPAPSFFTTIPSILSLGDQDVDTRLELTALCDFKQNLLQPLGKLSDVVVFLYILSAPPAHGFTFLSGHLIKFDDRLRQSLWIPRSGR